jgi:hypothetical protein
LLTEAILREPSVVMPFTCAISEARRIGLPWPQVMPLQLIDEVEMRIEMDDVDRLLVRVGCDRRHGDGVVAAKNVGHRFGVERLSDRQLGVRQTALSVGIEDVAVAGVHDFDFLRGEIVTSSSKSNTPSGPKPWDIDTSRIARGPKRVPTR